MSKRSLNAREKKIIQEMKNEQIHQQRYQKNIEITSQSRQACNHGIAGLFFASVGSITACDHAWLPAIGCFALTALFGLGAYEKYKQYSVAKQELTKLTLPGSSGQAISARPAPA